MKSASRLTVTFILIVAFLVDALPCGPGYISPIFETSSAPENPYNDFAAGKLGIIKQKFHRSVLYAAYRYIAGNGVNAIEQKSLTDVWKAEIDNKDFPDDTMEAAVKTWVDKRLEVVGKEEKTPEIYTERGYGGYEFFPNCTSNAFETAVQTLADRISSYGSSDPNVLNWVKAQDQVFQNCATGKQTPEEAPAGAPDWLKKDRAYQKAASEFYSLDYEAAKRHFTEITQDSDSSWAETADYLVGRTLIRQASLAKDKEKADAFYDLAETHLQKFVSRSGKFESSAERMSGLIAYKRRPKERVSELAKKLTVYGSGDNFRQDVIDYTWLLDKFESEILTAEEKRKESEKPKEVNSEISANAGSVAANAAANAANAMASAANSIGRKADRGQRKNDDDVELTLFSSDYTQSWTFYIRPDANDDEAISEAEKVVGQPLNEEMRSRVRNMRQGAYAGRFTTSQKPAYDGGYWGEEKMSPNLLPEFLRKDELTDWLYTYQMPGPEAYLYSLNKFKNDGSTLWLMTAISKADKASTGLSRLLEAAAKVTRMSPAFATIAYHRARILLQQGKNSDAKKLLDDLLDLGDDLPVSSRNSIMSLRLNMAETLEDFLKYSLMKPYAFDFDGDVGTIEEFITEQKGWYDPETNKDGREAYEREIEDRYKEQKLWQDRLMFDDDTIELFNQHFTTDALIGVMRSPALPDYMRERFAVAIWTRAFLLNDTVTVNKLLPELAKYRPELAPLLDKVAAAKTPAARDNALLYFVLKTPLLSPFIESGMGKDNNEQDQWSSDDWWCSPYDTEYNDQTSQEEIKTLPPRPAFLTAAQSKQAQIERKQLKDIGDAPKFLAEKVMAWAKRSPADRRIPEALFIVIEANGWTKYGCGNNEDLHDEMAKYLKRNFPNSEWTAKLREEESEK